MTRYFIPCRLLRAFVVTVVLISAGCNTTPDDRQAFYTSALIQEAWFAIQAEPAPDAWEAFELAVLSVPADMRETVRKTAIKEAKDRAAKN